MCVLGSGNKGVIAKAQEQEPQFRPIHFVVSDVDLATSLLLRTQIA